jgi:hypothetical protein
MDPRAETADPQGNQTRRRLLAAGAAGAAGAGLLAAGPADAQVPLPPDERYVWRNRMPVNVKDYGAVGDGSEDDTDAIQSALDDEVGGTVYLPPGRYSITGLNIRSDNELFGAGWNSELVVATDAGIYPLHIVSGAHDIRLHDFAIDGNKDAIDAANPSYDPDDNNGGPRVALIADGFTNSCSRIYVDRLRVFDQYRLGIVFQSVVDGAVRDCVVEGNNRDGITVYFDTRNVAIRGNRITRCGDDHIGINSENGTPTGPTTGHLCEGILVTENTITGPSSRTAPTGPKGPGIQVRGGKDIVIANNLIRAITQGAITVHDFGSTSATDIVISGNLIYRSGDTGLFDKMGISIHNGQSHIRRVSIVGNVLQETRQVAIRLYNQKTPAADDDIRDVLIAHNSIEDSAQEGIAVGSGGINDILIESNRIKGSAGTGINCTSPAKRVHIRGNLVYRGAGSGIRIAVINGGSCEGNQVYDDRGTSATQNLGIYMFALSGVWAFRDNTVWGHVNNADYDIRPGTHAATFDGPYRVLFGTTGWNPGPLPDGAVATTPVTVTGATFGDPCSVGLSVAVPGGMLLTANVTAANTVTVTLFNKTGGTVDLAGGTVWVHAQKPPPRP